MYRYHLNEKDLKDVEIVLANGEPFSLTEGKSLSKDRKREYKAQYKSIETEEQKGIDVTGFVKQTRSKAQGMILTIDIEDCKQCIFKTPGGGSNAIKIYTC